MRTKALAASAAALLLLPGCAEVTRFERAGQPPIYYVDCQNHLLVLESCAAAARRVCPGGYTRVDRGMDLPKDEDFGQRRCQKERAQAGETEAQRPCPPSQPAQGLFACR